MAETTQISWADSSINFWIGCTKVGPGCDHCYAEVSTPSRAHKILWGAGQPRHRTAAATWKQAHTWQRQAISFFMEHGRKRRVFPNSLSDFFDNEVSVEWRREALEVIDATPDLIYLIVTKRIGNVKRMLKELGREELPVNIWLGITVVNQEEADRDIPKLLAVPAVVRFLSIEPMLGPITLPPIRCDRGSLPGPGGAGGITCPDCNGHGERGERGCLRLHWVIVGGESGPKARPFVLGHAKDIVRQCRAAGVAVHVKQIGARPVNREGEPHPIVDRAGRDPAEWPLELRVQEFPA